MIDLKVQRQQLDGGVTKFQFDVFSQEFIVKNYSLGDIYVSFVEGFDEENSIRIASGMGQVVSINDAYDYSESFITNAIYIMGTGEVEVQANYFRMWKTEA